jgi:hypothetical protein
VKPVLEELTLPKVGDNAELYVIVDDPGWTIPPLDVTQTPFV